jgi:hypothetical protein
MPGLRRGACRMRSGIGETKTAAWPSVMGDGIKN